MKRNVAKGRKQLARLEDIPNIGPAIAGRPIGIVPPSYRDVILSAYDEYAVPPRPHPCLLDTFIAAPVHGGRPWPW
jgi:hypothetical protein